MLLSDPSVKLTKVGEFEGRMVLNHAWCDDHNTAKTVVAQKIHEEFSHLRIAAVTVHEIPEAQRVEH